MKVRRLVELSQEVEIEIGHEAIRTAVNAAPDPTEAWLTVLNRVVQCLNALPDAIIAAWTPELRQGIGTILTQHATRFQKNEETMHG